MHLDSSRFISRHISRSVDVSTAMENNTTECENEKLAIDSVTKRKIGSGSVKASIKNDGKRKIVSGSVKEQKDTHKQANCEICDKCGESFSSIVTLGRHICQSHEYVDEEDSEYETNEDVTTVANKKCRDKTKVGIASKRKYTEKANVKRHISNHLSMIHGSYETIKKLVKML